MSETPGMAQHEVTRTLVKSQPEVWTQCSDADSLGRHLSGSFGEIRITRLEPEHSVAWEGEEVSGTVRIEPSAWGTRVTLTVELADEVADLEQAAPPPVVEAVAAPRPEAEPAPEAEVVAAPEPAEAERDSPPDAQREPEPIRSRWARLRSWWRSAASVEPPLPEEPAVHEPAAPEEPPVVEESVVEEPVTEEPVAPEPGAPAEPEAKPAEAEPPADTAAVLSAALESLGQAHHRPFSRA